MINKLLTESIFSSNPVRKAKAVGHLKRLLREPLRAKDAHAKIKKHADDEKLLSNIKHFHSTAPDSDVRPVLKKRMKELNIQGF
jgi:hypothetical protein